ncbi:MAG: iron ABC transporter permease [Idiomarina sp.]|nr:iron ABC transporter permease [Idiomarina sp.]
MMNHRWTLLALIAVSAVLALHAGAVDISVWRALFGNVESPADLLARQILLDVRLPRVLLALCAGFGLAMAGAAMQGLLRNPLAEPGILGISGGAAVVSVLVLYFGLALWHSFLLPLSAVLGSLAALLLLLGIAGRRASTTTLILAGIACSAFFSGLIALALSVAPNPFAMQEMSFWLMGSVAYRDLDQLVFMAPFLLAGVVLVWRSAPFLRALTLGEDTALTLGFAVGRERLLLLLGTALLVGSCVAMTGVIGFVGLIVPHLMRRWVAADPGKLLLSSGLAGAVFLLWADMLVQWLPTPSELRVGVVLTLFGGPFFLWILLRGKHGWSEPR